LYEQECKANREESEQVMRDNEQAFKEQVEALRLAKEKELEELEHQRLAAMESALKESEIKER
jgi:hypothetical protein